MEQPPLASWRGSFTSGVSGFEQSTIVLNSCRNQCILLIKLEEACQSGLLSSWGISMQVYQQSMAKE
jgi:hypothetical protein